MLILRDTTKPTLVIIINTFVKKKLFIKLKMDLILSLCGGNPYDISTFYSVTFYNARLEKNIIV